MAFPLKLLRDNSVSKVLLGGILIGLLTACGGAPRGEFAWTATDDRQIREPEKSLLITRSYRRGRKLLYFFNYQTVRWVYWIRENPPAPGTTFTVALYENNNTPTPVEVDLRQVPLEVQSDAGFLRQQYDPLAPGRYLLKVAYKGEVIDMVRFQIVPPGGPGVKSTRNPFGEGQRNPDDDSPDEVIRYSS